MRTPVHIHTHHKGCEQWASILNVENKKDTWFFCRMINFFENKLILVLLFLPAKSPAMLQTNHPQKGPENDSFYKRIRCSFSLHMLASVVSSCPYALPMNVKWGWQVRISFKWTVQHRFGPFWSGIGCTRVVMSIRASASIIAHKHSWFFSQSLT